MTTLRPLTPNPSARDELKTAADVIAKIPPHWRSAEIFMSCEIGGVCRINRVSLMRNKDGRRVVMLHQPDFSK